MTRKKALPQRMASMQGRQTSMSYPGQGRPVDAEGSSLEKAKPKEETGRSKPSAQENLRNRKRIAEKPRRRKST
jgi:hypothetical protein